MKTAAAGLFAGFACAGMTAAQVGAHPRPSIADEASKEARRATTFPNETLYRGECYRRLRSSDLDLAVRGKSAHSESSPSEEDYFERAGAYGEFGDQSWESWGRYFIINDMVVVRHKDGWFQRFAFYRADDGKTLRSWETRSRPVFQAVILN